LVDGERQTVEITDNGQRFVTSGSTNATSRHMRVSGGNAWQPPLSEG
jgi:hypothetical protein